MITIANVTGEPIIRTDIGNRINCLPNITYLLTKEDILISLTGNVGRVSKMPEIKAVLNQRVGKLVFTKETKVDKDFVFHSIHNEKFEFAMSQAGQGAAQKNISNTDVLQFRIKIPGVAEQNKIATFLTSIDNLITLHQRKCDQLKTIKKALLQKMFV